MLDSALTSMTVGGRILGQSRTTEGLALRAAGSSREQHLPRQRHASAGGSSATWRPNWSGPKSAGPGNADLLEYVREHRAELVRAALAILRAHAVAGRPRTGGRRSDLRAMGPGRRGAVWFATGRDCNTTRRKAAEESPDRQNKLALLEAWGELPNGGPGGGSG